MKKKNFKKPPIFLQEKTYMRILHQKTDKIHLKHITWQLCLGEENNQEQKEWRGGETERREEERKKTD